MPEKIFVSYPHDKFKAVLGHGAYAQKFKLWIDEQQLKPSDDVDRSITEAIASSQVALVLVSKSFLTSDYITSKEIEAILQRHDIGALSVWWIPVDALKKSQIELTKLARIKAAWPLNKPLAKLGDEIDDAIHQISDKLADACVLKDKTDDDTRMGLRECLEKALGINSRLREAVAYGDRSVLYRAERFGASIAVKALIPSPRSPWLRQQFVDRARRVAGVKNESAIRIRDVIDRPDVQCVAMDFVDTPTLKKRLEQNGPLPCAEVVRVLHQLCRVARDLHKLPGAPLVGPIRPSHVHYDDDNPKARISLVHIANETIPKMQETPTVLLDDDALTYLSPERYAGAPLDYNVDQYYLGLLALELLAGKPPVEIERFADLETKVRFFDNPRAFFGDDVTKNQPALSFVLARMLERSPEKRWPSMAELTDVLGELADGAVPDVVRAHAADDYERKLGNNQAFIAAFYHLLLDSSPAIRRMFDERNVSVADQARKLNDSMVDVFNFRPVKPSTLDKHVQKHTNMGLEPGHFDAFRDAFLQALKAVPDTGEYSQDAWRALFDPALDYMRERTAARPN